MSEMIEIEEYSGHNQNSKGPIIKRKYYKIISYIIVFLVICLIFLYYSFSASDVTSNYPSMYYDVLVIGGGAAGLAAAISARKQNPNISIAIFEQQSKLGGDSIKATSGINCGGTAIQACEGVLDCPEKFYTDTIVSGQGSSNPKLVKILTQKSRDAWDFLTEMGVDLSAVTQCGGHSISRTHRPKTNTIGREIVMKLSKKLQNFNIGVFLNSPIIRFNKGGKLEAAYLQNNTEIKFKAVIIAAGGFGNDNEELIKENAPHLIGFPTTTGPQALGAGMKLARTIGANLIQLSNIQIHPTGFVDRSNPNARQLILAPELLRGVGAVMINAEGKRFCNELGLRDYVSSQILKCCSPFANCVRPVSLLLFNGQAAEIFGLSLQFYIGRGLIVKIGALEMVPEFFSVSIAKLNETIEAYNKAADSGKDEFGKTQFPQKFRQNDTFYGGLITPVIHYTMGGVEIDENAKVVGKSGPIKGLFAAGEVTGGIHGKNRLVGNSILECIVFGRIAGESAARHSSGNLGEIYNDFLS